MSIRYFVESDHSFDSPTIEDVAFKSAGAAWRAIAEDILRSDSDAAPEAEEIAELFRAGNAHAVILGSQVFFSVIGV